MSQPDIIQTLEFIPHGLTGAQFAGLVESIADDGNRLYFSARKWYDDGLAVTVSIEGRISAGFLAVSGSEQHILRLDERYHKFRVYERNVYAENPFPPTFEQRVADILSLAELIRNAYQSAVSYGFPLYVPVPDEPLLPMRMSSFKK